MNIYMGDMHCPVAVMHISEYADERAPSDGEPLIACFQYVLLNMISCLYKKPYLYTFTNTIFFFFRMHVLWAENSLLKLLGHGADCGCSTSSISHLKKWQYTTGDPTTMMKTRPLRSLATDATDLQLVELPVDLWARNTGQLGLPLAEELDDLRHFRSRASTRSNQQAQHRWAVSKSETHEVHVRAVP